MGPSINESCHHDMIHSHVMTWKLYRSRRDLRFEVNFMRCHHTHRYKFELGRHVSSGRGAPAESRAELLRASTQYIYIVQVAAFVGLIDKNVKATKQEIYNVAIGGAARVYGGVRARDGRAHHTWTRLVARPLLLRLTSPFIAR